MRMTNPPLTATSAGTSTQKGESILQDVRKPVCTENTKTQTKQEKYIQKEKRLSPGRIMASLTLQVRKRTLQRKTAAKRTAALRKNPLSDCKHTLSVKLLKKLIQLKILN